MQGGIRAGKYPKFQTLAFTVWNLGFGIQLEFGVCNLLFAARLPLQSGRREIWDSIGKKLKIFWAVTIRQASSSY